MASDANIEANRQNAQLSTGPTTEAGKAASSMNSLQHGLYANTVILPGEDTHAFDLIHDEYQSRYDPQNVEEQDLVDQLAAAKWRMRRTAYIEAEFFSQRAGLPADRCLAAWNHLSQFQGRFQRQWAKAQSKLDEIRRARQKETLQPHPDPQDPPPDKTEALSKKPVEENDDDKWATPEEWEAQIKKKPLPRNFKPPKKFQLNSYLGPNGEKVCVARIYKGKSVDKFPDEE